VFRAYLKDGQICQDEFNYIHLSKRTMPTNGVNEDCDSFYITSSGFWPKTAPETKQDIKRYEPYRPLLEFRRFLHCKHADTKAKFSYYCDIVKQKICK
jgi:hypothetical protein